MSTDHPSDSSAESVSLSAVARLFGLLGLTSFGGPTAHIGYLRRAVVTERRWVAPERFESLVALCQFLPGPASSQLVYALGRELAGHRGAWLASACFTLPSALLMTLAALPVSRQWMDGAYLGPWRHGLLVAACAVVGHAVWSMARSLGRSGVRGAIAALALLTTLRVASPLAQPLVIAAGALIGTLMLRIGGDARAMDRRNGNDRSASNGLLLVLSVPLLGLILTVAASHWPDRATTLAAAFYRAGALVFGGGHVVLPLLREAVVTPGWLSPATFLTGYALAQLVPGPLFTLAANLGTACGTSGAAPALGMLALLALFLPGWLLVAGALPWWSNLQQWPWARGAVSGAGAAVVGVLTAALLGPVAHEALHDATDLVCAFIAFGLLIPGRLPMPLVVLATTVACGWMSR